MSMHWGLLTAAILYFGSTQGSSRRWCQYLMRCMDGSSAMTRWSSESLQGCLFKASSAPDDLVLQWNKQTGVCSIFHFQHVCRMMQASGAEPVGAGAGAGDLNQLTWSAEQCSVYRASALSSCSASLDAHFVGVWLAGGSNRLTNLVCQSDAAASYRLEIVNVQWMEEGAQFNGRSSYALLNDSRFIRNSTASGFTWLIRLKRRPSTQPFITLKFSNSSGDFEVIFFEQSLGLQFMVLRNGYLVQGSSSSSPASVLPSDPNRLLTIGFLIQPGVSQPKVFLDQDFVFMSAVSVKVADFLYSDSAVVGHAKYSGVDYFLAGEVRFVALANRPLSKQDIVDFVREAL